MSDRSLTMLNEAGDTTISWTPDRDEEMEQIIKKKMDEGVTFFVVDRRGRPPAQPKSATTSRGSMKRANLRRLATAAKSPVLAQAA